MKLNRDILKYYRNEYTDVVVYNNWFGLPTHVSCGQYPYDLAFCENNKWYYKINDRCYFEYEALKILKLLAFV